MHRLIYLLCLRFNLSHSPHSWPQAPRLRHFADPFARGLVCAKSIFEAKLLYWKKETRSEFRLQ